MNAIQVIDMELKRINVMVPDDVHDILSDYQKKHSYRSKDKALTELLKEFARTNIN